MSKIAAVEEVLAEAEASVGLLVGAPFDVADAARRSWPVGSSGWRARSERCRSTCSRRSMSTGCTQQTGTRPPG